METTTVFGQEFRVRDADDKWIKFKIGVPVALMVASWPVAFYALVTSNGTVAIVSIAMFFGGLALGLYFLYKLVD